MRIDQRDQHLGLIAVAAFVLCACAEGPATSAPDVRSEVEEGRALAHRECARCHGVSELGSSPRPGVPPLHDVLDGYDPSMLETAFREGLIIGHPDMPLFDFSDGQIDALLAYLQDIN